jgi:sulfhydrogenase subunit alpha
MALRPDDPAYRFRGTTLCTSNGGEYPAASYREVVREYAVEHSHAKHAALVSGETYMVGALARLWLLSDRLCGRAREAFERLFPDGVQPNVLLNNWAQLVEVVHCLERGVVLCDELLGMPETVREATDYEVRAGRGIAAIEVPRGILFHEYEIDERGTVVAANVVTPTAQNLANVERDLRVAAESLLATGVSGGDAELQSNLEMVVRAYDPCISCSVHVVRVDS